MPSKTKPKLTDGHRSFIVQRLACYEPLQKVQDELKETFGVEIAKQSIQHYDPTKRQGVTGQLAKRWRDLFDKTREDFHKSIEVHIPGANKAVRMARYERYVQSFEARNNLIAAADMTERQAKEMGNVHTNKREHTGKDGRPMQFENVNNMTPEQLNDELRERLKNPALREWVMSLGIAVPAAATPAIGRETKQ